MWLVEVSHCATRRLNAVRATEAALMVCRWWSTPPRYRAARPVVRLADSGMFSRGGLGLELQGMVRDERQREMVPYRVSLFETAASSTQ